MILELALFLFPFLQLRELIYLDWNEGNEYWWIRRALLVMTLDLVQWIAILKCFSLRIVELWTLLL